MKRKTKKSNQKKIKEGDIVVEFYAYVNNNKTTHAREIFMKKRIIAGIP